ncbi:MAG: hypothetical protein K6A92_10765 [Lachnospiraceae bacterium]|nr:hypothetical protein [Lachnospiraceae bacterium]
MKNFKTFLTEEDGMGTVEMVLLLVVAVGLVILFKNQITSLVNSMFQTISSRAGSL